MSEGYREYIQSQSWRIRRRIFIRKAGYKCKICGAKNKTLHVHHLTYRNFGDEQDDDIVVLCEDCHKEVHEVVDYALLRYERWKDCEDLNWWDSFPHMRHAPEGMVEIVVATFFNLPIRYYDWETCEITYNNKRSYFKFSSRKIAFNYAIQSRLLKNQYYCSAEVLPRIQSKKLNAPVYWMEDSEFGNAGLSDELHYRYNRGEDADSRHHPLGMKWDDAGFVKALDYHREKGVDMDSLIRKSGLQSYVSAIEFRGRKQIQNQEI